jgi:hypothetical protein
VTVQISTGGARFKSKLIDCRFARLLVSGENELLLIYLGLNLGNSEMWK